MREYLTKWERAESPKPVNDPQFISDFTDFIRDVDTDHFKFDGQNHYCGFTAVVYENNPNYPISKGMAFELAYANNFIKVFDANNNGYWVPEYIDLKDSQSAQIVEILKKRLLQWAGLN